MISIYPVNYFPNFLGQTPALLFLACSVIQIIYTTWIGSSSVISLCNQMGINTLSCNCSFQTSFLVDLMYLITAMSIHNRVLAVKFVLESTVSEIEDFCSQTTFSKSLMDKSNQLRSAMQTTPSVAVTDLLLFLRHCQVTFYHEVSQLEV